MANGPLTRQVGKSLQQRFTLEGLTVYYDHGDSSSESVSRIVASFGPTLSRESQLAFVDIVVADKASGVALALIEVEETTIKPKILLGDFFATALGKQLTVQGRTLLIGPSTAFLIFAKGEKRTRRMKFLQEQANRLAPCLGTPNSKLGQIAF